MSYQVFISHSLKKVIKVDASYMRLRRLQKRVRNWAELISQKNNTLLMVTLTYENKGDFNYNDIRSFMLKVKYRYRGRLLAYSWVSELQKRGVIHYHVLLLIAGMAKTFHPDSLKMWKKGLSNCVRARSPFYISKYTGKEKQKDFKRFPRGIRAFAVWIHDEGARVELRFRSLKGWEKGAVLADGWESLRFWRLHAKGLSEWSLYAFYDDELEAENEITQWRLMGYEYNQVAHNEKRQKSGLVFELKQ